MDIELINEICNKSNQTNELAFKLLAGSLAAILTTSFTQPVAKKWKLIYLLFFPGWLFLFLSMSSSDELNRSVIMAKIAYANIPKNLISQTIPQKITLDPQTNNSIKYFNDSIATINEEYSNQLIYAKRSIGSFCLWLSLYLLWWIFFAKSVKDEKL